MHMPFIRQKELKAGHKALPKVVLKVVPRQLPKKQNLQGKWDSRKMSLPGFSAPK